MPVRFLMLGLLAVGAAGQVACFTEAEAAQDVTTEEAPSPEGPEEGAFCGGIAAIACPEGLVCEDDPNDSCDPNQGGADCGGRCVSPDAQKNKKTCDRTDPTLDYVSYNPDECPAILFQCPEGSSAFFNECGCGCTRPQGACNYQDPNRRYLVQSKEKCATIRFFCEPNEVAFFDECGCGCEYSLPP